ncbi:MAG: cell division ATP-binding protein FtsE [Peptococcaceae bacterium]|nr:cell division ATP-binding protein FtsE [Peptococcaceae bacterium]
MIQFINVSKEFPNGTVGLKNIDVKIEEGEFVFLVGASGAGKSTFTKLLIREMLPTEGNILVNGKSINRLKQRQVPHFRRNIGFIFQNYRLLGDRTAFENVAFAVEALGAAKREVERKVDYALRLVGLEDRKTHFPDELSGGEQQRVAIARAIVNNPQIIIADEPTGNLDPETAKGIMTILNDINIKGTTIVMATHDAGIVNRASHRVMELSRGELVRDDKQGGYNIDFI